MIGVDLPWPWLVAWYVELIVIAGLTVFVVVDLAREMWATRVPKR